ncbi:pyridoxal-dependent aspartate 1-decarboxylase PanP [Desulfonema magnum]|uniref:Aspartate 1-decarboxylase n=1 Tax=Desulfonema magnum TaxID=45655 RepID=A0A975BNP0_9BACT|nr:putative pyridoxal-dependent aspartate 1-decarboxylase [Desulfonema magnum]QTA88876.1 Aspartate 1-decarboxylase [Desulfonema magnum]
MTDKQSFSEKTALVANWQNLQRIFIRPETEESRAVLVKYMEQILFGLHDFLRKHVGITKEASLKKLSEQFTDSRINVNPVKKLADVIRGIIEDIAPHAVNVASPYFIGHMTSAIPFFMVHLQTIVAALNQNPVKLETSKIVSALERQVLAKIHRRIYNQNEAFYNEHIQQPDSTFGSFVEDGTLANLTALWVARNFFFKPRPGFAGVEKEGMMAACQAYGIERCVVLVSQLAHYSLRKAGGVLGIGNTNILPIEVDANNTINLDKLKSAVQAIQKNDPKTKILALVGIAGATETGTVDPLPKIAELCAEHKIHFHVDAAWGGPTLLSEKYRSLLSGIEKADSVTIDGHKQFYMPMSCGMVYFKDPHIMDVVAYHAAYINRPGSVDLGIRSLVGSRAATSLILKSALEIMGTEGYALLIDHGIETARAFAEEIQKRPLFELVTRPQLNILTYRIFPEPIRKEWDAADTQKRKALTERLNNINIIVQRLQREAGKSFVSRTTLRRAGREDTVVLRSVIMNPMTTMEIIREILDEQEHIYHSQFAIQA